MRLLYTLTTGTKDPTKASLPVHLAVNGSVANDDEPAIFLAGDGTEWVDAAAIDAAEGIGVPPMRELFEKVKQHEVPVFV